MEKVTKHPKLTDREKEVINLLAECKNNREIAETLNITTHTVKAHLLNIFEKFNVHTKIQVVIAAIKLGIIDIENKVPF